MILHLVRHGDANPRQGSWSTDDDRPLSSRGREQARRIGEALHRLGARPDLLLTSPLIRAVETANEISSALLTGSEPVVTAVLRPGAAAGAVLEEIARHHAGSNEVVCTGHMPDLGYMASQLGAGPESAPFRLQTGSLVRIDLDGRTTRLVWLLSPDVVHRLTSPV